MTLETVHLTATLFMMGVIAFVQVVHYPLMARVGKMGYVDYQQAHMRRTAWVVIPAMTVELGSAVGLLVLRWGTPDGPLALVGGALLGGHLALHGPRPGAAPRAAGVRVRRGTPPQARLVELGENGGLGGPGARGDWVDVRRGGGGLFARPGKLFTADQSLKADGGGQVFRPRRTRLGGRFG